LARPKVEWDEEFFCGGRDGLPFFGSSTPRSCPASQKFRVPNFHGLKSTDLGGWDEESNYKMGVSKNRGTPKWMVYNGKPY